jgi:hypothetical protein
MTRLNYKSLNTSEQTFINNKGTIINISVEQLYKTSFSGCIQPTGAKQESSRSEQFNVRSSISIAVKKEVGGSLIWIPTCTRRRGNTEKQIII